jgi:hypothetical protein
MMNEGTTISIVAHDAGGAEILACYVSQNRGQYKFSLQGPAIEVFEKKFGLIQIDPFEEAIDESEWCLCGTGWQSDFEWRALVHAKNKNKRVIAFLDHWTNYSERFIKCGVQCLPDEIWVGDVEAKKIAESIFESIPIILCANPYWIEIESRIKEYYQIKNSNTEENTFKILYASENISEMAIKKHGNKRYFGYTEIDSIRYFMSNLSLVAPIDAQVTLRPHPSDVIGKYDGILSEYQQIQLSNGRPLIEEVLEADLVVGCESMALVIGVLSGKKVVSSIPLSDVQCRLPQAQILRLSDMVKGKI